MKNSFKIAAVLFFAAAGFIFASGRGEDGPAGADRSGGGKLRVAATTTIVGDVVKMAAGNCVELTVLMKPGQNPHSYEPSPRDAALLENADIIFLNGAGLEESLMSLLEGLENPTLVSLSDEFAGDCAANNNGRNHNSSHNHNHGHSSGSSDLSGDSGCDPHVWFSPLNILHWIESIETALQSADPDNAESYRKGAEEAVSRILNLDAEIRIMVSEVPEANRKLVTGHASLGHFACEYGFEMAGSILAGFSDQSEPSARELTALVEHLKDENIKAVFIGKTAGKNVMRLAESVAEEAGAAGRNLAVVPLLTGSLARPGERGSDYIDFMRYNAEQITEALK